MEQRCGKYVIGVLGALLAAVSWFVDHHQDFPLIERVLASRYSQARTALTTLRPAGAVLRPGDHGFDELGELLAEEIVEPKDPVLTEIRTASWGWRVVNYKDERGMADEPYVRLLLVLSDGRSAELTYGNPVQRVTDRYLDPTLFRWATFGFWLGLLITLASVFS